MPIKKVKGGFVIENVKMKPTTKQKATERLKAIKANQSKKK